MNDIDDLERELPGAVHALREWLRDYKVPEGKPENKFALGERAMPAAFAKKARAGCMISLNGEREKRGQASARAAGRRGRGGGGGVSVARRRVALLCLVRCFRQQATKSACVKPNSPPFLPFR